MFKSVQKFSKNVCREKNKDKILLKKQWNRNLFHFPRNSFFGKPKRSVQIRGESTWLIFSSGFGSLCLMCTVLPQIYREVLKVQQKGTDYKARKINKNYLNTETKNKNHETSQLHLPVNIPNNYYLKQVLFNTLQTFDSNFPHQSTFTISKSTMETTDQYAKSVRI